MNPVQYIILNKSLGMSTGKAAAQAAHASTLGLLTHVDNDTTKSPFNHSIVNRWMMGGHKAVVVLEADDLPTVERYLNDRGFKTALVIDEGRTEIEPMSPTAIGTGVVDKDQGHVRATFGEFKLYDDALSDDEIMERAAKISDDRLRALVTPEFIEKITRAEDEAFLNGTRSDVLGKTWDFDRDGVIADLDDSDPTGNLEGPGRVPPADDPKRPIRDMFRRVRERLGEARLDAPPTSGCVVLPVADVPDDFDINEYAPSGRPPAEQSPFDKPKISMGYPLDREEHDAIKRVLVPSAAVRGTSDGGPADVVEPPFPWPPTVRQT